MPVLNLIPRQREALATIYARGETFLLGGVRSGKSLITAEAAVQSAFEWEPDVAGCLAAPTWGQLERNLIEPWKELAPRGRYDIIANPKDPRIECYTGEGRRTRVVLASGKNPPNLEGATLGWAGATELQQMPRMWAQIRRRVSDKRAKRRRLWGDGLTEEGWLAKEVAKRGIAVVYFSTHENAHNLVRGYLAEQARTLTPRQWDIYILGKWAGSENAVYPTFSRERHANPLRRVRYRPELGRVYGAQDWNLNPMTTVFCQWDGATLWGFDELIRPNTVIEHAEDIKRHLRTKYDIDPCDARQHVIIPDATGSRRNQGDGLSNLYLFRRAGLHLVGPAANPPIGDSTQALLVLIENALHEVHLYLDPERCEKTIDALANLRHDDPDDSVYSHPCAALRYAAHFLAPVRDPRPRKPKSAGRRQGLGAGPRRGRVAL